MIECSRDFLFANRMRQILDHIIREARNLQDRERVHGLRKRGAEEIPEELESLLLQNPIISALNTIRKSKTPNLISPPTVLGLGMEMFCVPISKLDPFLTGFFIPMQFFLK